MTISEVSEKYEISAEILRYYEIVGVIPPVNRNENGIRNAELVTRISNMQTALDRLI
jgi:predicted site-specific integrase-resolvase